MSGRTGLLLVIMSLPNCSFQGAEPMNHEISELDIPDRQLLASNAKPSIWTEIGEAQITHTIFGRAKVRIIRKNENRHRIFWVLGVVVLAIAAAVWQGLFTLQLSKEDQNTDQSSVSAKVPVRAPVTQSEKSASPETPAEAFEKLRAPIQAEIDKPGIPKSEPHQIQAPKLPEPKLVNPEVSRPKPDMVQRKPLLAQPGPVTAERGVVVRPQAAPYAGNREAKAPAGTATSVNSISPKQSGPTAVSVMKPVPQTAASSPAATIQFSDPLQKPVDSPVDNPAAVPDGTPNK
jgi:hypothetical protein